MTMTNDQFNKGPFTAEVYRTSNSDIINALTDSAKNWVPEFYEDGEYEHAYLEQPQAGDVVIVIDNRSQSGNPLAGIVGRFVCGGNDEVLPLTQVGYTDDWVIAK